MNKVFISHPYSDNPKLRLLQVDYICSNLPPNILPISPLHLFSFEDDDSRREEILQVCFNLIDMCDEVYIYDYNGGYHGLSGGQKYELHYAMSRLYRGELTNVEYKDPPLEVNDMIYDKCENCNRICDTRCEIERWNEIIADFSKNDAEYYSKEGFILPKWASGKVTDEKEFIVTECERKQGLRI